MYSENRESISPRQQRDKLLKAIRAGAYDAFLLSPPCSAFSIAPWANFRGPRPVRSYAKPQGFDTLTGAERRRCILGNIFADFTWEEIADRYCLRASGATGRFGGYELRTSLRPAPDSQSFRL